MLSYRHAFHAGNHADVLKHFVTIQLLQYMNQKETAYSYIDTHSGAGVYALDGNFASKNAEYDTGIGPLWQRDDLPPALKEYVDLVKAMNPSGKMRYYPGSPYCADQIAREQDRLRLFELHPADAKILADNFRKVEAHAAAQGQRPAARGKRVMITKGDGFLHLKAQLPPASRRGLILIDPPYEDKTDYRKVKDALADALGRFPTGTYAVWYPLLQRMESRQFADKLKQLPCKEWLHVTLTVSTPGPDGFGLHSSGMFVLNPPYTLEPMLRTVMPYLVEVLGKDEGAMFNLETGVGGTMGSTARRPAVVGPRSAEALKARGPGARLGGPGPTPRSSGSGPVSRSGGMGSAARGGNGPGSGSAGAGPASGGRAGGSGSLGGKGPGPRGAGGAQSAPGGGPANGRPGTERAPGARPSSARPAGSGARPARPGGPRTPGSRRP